MTRKRAIGSLAACLLFAGCLTGDGMYSKLVDAATGYNRHLRWGDIDRASAYLPPPSRDPFIARYGDVAEKLVIVEYEVTRLKIDKQAGVAASRVEMSWHTEDRLILEKTIVDQTWQWYEGDWVLVDERHVGGRSVGVLGELEPDGEHPYLPGLAAFRATHEIGPENRSRAPRRRRRGRADPAPPA